MDTPRKKRCCLNILAVLLIWNSFGLQRTIADTAGLSSRSAYFLFRQAEYPRDCQEVYSSCTSTQSLSGVFTIKPDGYPTPIEVYCDNSSNSGGWTLLQRRLNGTINFNRDWNDYKNGFGFLGSEFWIGNEKLAYLTNQKLYQLRIDIHNGAGQSYHVIYDNFRIGDEWGRYSLTSIGSMSGTVGPNIEWCPTNKKFSSETCERSCADPSVCIQQTYTELENCVCPDNYAIQAGNCIPQNECNCFVQELDYVLQDGDSVINSACTRRSQCRNDRLIQTNYQCSDDATCQERDDGVRRCYCNDGYDGDGETCTLTRPRAVDCYELYVAGETISKVYTIYPNGWSDGLEVFCDMESSGGGWTVFQRRSSAAVNFYRGWDEYKNGFEHPTRDHWLGNDKIHALTNQKTYKLRIDARNSDGSSLYIIFNDFSINDETDKYRLSVGSKDSGNIGDSNIGDSNGYQFSTHDQDNDPSSDYNCAERHRGAWWFHFDYDYDYSDYYCYYCGSGEGYCDYFPDDSNCCYFCTYVSLNGDYGGSTRGTNIFWDGMSGYDCGIQYTEMKIKPG